MSESITLQQICSIVEDVWDIKITQIIYLVGYDVINYLATVYPKTKPKTIPQNPNTSQHPLLTKYIIKLYISCGQSQLKLLQQQNHLLQYLSAKTNFITNIKTQYRQQEYKYYQYPSPISIVNNQNNLIANKYIYHKQLKNNHGDCQFISVRVLSYIEGKMFGQYLQHANNTQDQHLILSVIQKIPKFIAQSITTPLIEYTKLYISLYLQQSCKLEFHHQLSKPLYLISRCWEWHIQSFIKQPKYYQQRYKMIMNNPNRPVLHGEIIQYFVKMYCNVKNALIKQEEKYITNKNNSKEMLLRKSVIHNDINQWNIVLHFNKNSNQLFPSIIDFGDIVYSYLIQDISLYSLYLIYNNPNKQQIISKLLKTIKIYSNIIPISELQLKLYMITIPMRMCLSLCNSEYAMKERPSDSYVSMSQKNGWKLLQVLKDLYHSGNQSKNHCSYQLCSIMNIFQSQFYQLLKNNTNLNNKGQLIMDNNKYTNNKTSNFAIDDKTNPCPAHQIHILVQLLTKYNINSQQKINIQKQLWSYDWIKIKLLSDNSKIQKLSTIINQSIIFNQIQYNHNEFIQQVYRLLSKFSHIYKDFKLSTDQ